MLPAPLTNILWRYRRRWDSRKVRAENSGAGTTHRLALAALISFAAAWYAAGIGSGSPLTSGDDYFYAASAVDIATGASLVHRFDSPALAYLYVPISDRPGLYASKYPLGVSVLLAPFYLVFGYHGLFALGPIAGALGVLATYLLASQMTAHRGVSLFAAAMLTGLPVVVSSASGIGSDLPSLTVVTSALAAYVWHLKSERPAGLWLFSFLAGVSFLVRAPNALVFGVIALHQGWRAYTRRSCRWWAWIPACIVFSSLLAIHFVVSAATFGSVIGGYATETRDQGGLALSWMPDHLRLYVVMLCAVPPLGLPCMAHAMWSKRNECEGVSLAFAGLTLAYVLLYSAWWSFAFDYAQAFIAGARFLLPVMPLLCVACAIACFDVVNRVGVRGAIIAACVAGEMTVGVLLTYQLRHYKGRMAAHREHIYASTEANALLVGPGDWKKLLLSRLVIDGRGAYAAYEDGDSRSGSDEVVRLVVDALDSGRVAYLLLSGVQAKPGEMVVVRNLQSRYRLTKVAEYTDPYDLTVLRVAKP